MTEKEHRSDIEKGRELLSMLIGEEKANELTPWQIMCECAAIEQSRIDRAPYMICPLLGF